MLQMTQDKRAIMLQQMDDIKMLMTELDDVEQRCREELAELNGGDHRECCTSAPNFGLGEDVDMLRDQVNALVQAEIAPLAEQAHSTTPSLINLATIGRNGLVGCNRTRAIWWCRHGLLSACCRNGRN